MTLEVLFAGRNIDIAAAQQRMSRLMAEEGLPYGSRTMTFNSRLAQELAAWADEEPGGDALHGALYRAYFVDGQNLSDIDVLVSLAEAVGLLGSQVRQILEHRTMRELVDKHWSTSIRAGITSVPTFEVCGYRVVGAQQEEVLRHLASIAP